MNRNDEETSIDARNARWRFILAVTLGAILIFVSGGMYRALAARFDGFDTGVRLPDGVLARMPQSIDGWSGRDEAIDPTVLDALDADQHLNRLYVAPSGFPTVSLFASIGGRLRDLAPHRPDVCFPSAGWTIIDAENRELHLKDGGLVPCQAFRFRRGGLSTEALSVISFYIINGRYARSVSVLRSMAWRKDAVGYVARIQLTCNASMSEGDDYAMLSAFASASAPLLQQILADVSSATGQLSE